MHLHSMFISRVSELNIAQNGECDHFEKNPSYFKNVPVDFKGGIGAILVPNGLLINRETKVERR